LLDCRRTTIFEHPQYSSYQDSKRGFLKIFLIISGCASQRGLWPPRPRGFLITHNDAPHSVGLLWTSDQLVAETSTDNTQYTRQISMPTVGFFF
jgi:hypothetical protein